MKTCILFNHATVWRGGLCDAVSSYLCRVRYARVVAGVGRFGLVDGEHEAAAALEAAAVVQPPHPVGRREAGVEGHAAQLQRKEERKEGK